MVHSLIYNGAVLPTESFQLSYQNRAFQYGDGVFETIRYENGHIWFWPDHCDRLREGLSVLAMQPSFEAERLPAQMLELIEKNGLSNGPVRIKVQVWRQPGGLYTPSSFDSDYLVTVQPSTPFGRTRKQKVGVFDAFRLYPSPLSACKTLNALPYVLAGIYKQQHDLDDVLLLDSAGHLAECLASNLFWINDNILFTPSLESGCINGVLRRQVLKNAQQNSLTVAEGLFLPTVLDQAELIFCTNVMGLQWIEWGGRTLPGPDEPLMQRAYRLLQFE